MFSPRVLDGMNANTLYITTRLMNNTPLHLLPMCPNFGFFGRSFRF